MAEEEKTPELSEEEESQGTTPEVDTAEGEVEEQGEVEWKPKFTQVGVTDKDEYLKKLEDLYSNSSREGLRLKKELDEAQKEKEIITKIIQSNPNVKDAFADTLYAGDYNDETTKIANIVRDVVRQEIGQNPALSSMEAERQAKDKAIYDRFVSEHPELETNAQLSDEFETAFASIATVEQKKNRVPDFEKTLKRAWTVVSGEQELAGMKKVIQKESAAMGSASSEGKAKPGQTLNETERKIAQALGLSDEDYLAGKKLSEEANKQ